MTETNIIMKHNMKMTDSDVSITSPLWFTANHTKIAAHMQKTTTQTMKATPNGLFFLFMTAFSLS